MLSEFTFFSLTSFSSPLLSRIFWCSNIFSSNTFYGFHCVIYNERFMVKRVFLSHLQRCETRVFVDEHKTLCFYIFCSRNFLQPFSFQPCLHWTGPKNQLAWLNATEQNLNDSVWMHVFFEGWWETRVGNLCEETFAASHQKIKNQRWIQ